MQTINNILQTNQFSESEELCSGCLNHCQVHCYHFSNGQNYFSGNNCERVYSNRKEGSLRGVNMFEEKYKMLFSQRTTGHFAPPQKPLTIGIPRGLGIYENYPFWHTLFTSAGFRVKLSSMSTNTLYEKGLNTIVADNICFPAKLMHGHVMDLIEKKVDRIFYPWVVFERQEDTEARNSFNCPIVSGYADVLRSAIKPENKYGIPLDSPTISFRDEDLLRDSLVEYLGGLGIHYELAQQAIEQAIAEQKCYLETLESRNISIVEQAQREGRLVILLAARPYHIDPLIQHKIADAIAEMGIDVITENVASHSGQSVYTHINALCQWAYPNRIFKAAEYVGCSEYSKLHMVELTSFGCGPDAFILDEVRGILSRYHKNLTVLKIDDVNTIGSLRLRVRSLVESVVDRHEEPTHYAPEEGAIWTTKTFEKEDRQRTILAPYFAEGYNEFIHTIFRMAGYHIEALPMSNQADAEEGLRVANNDVCYPATLVIGSILRALRSGKYDLKNTAVAITQTGGQCRASNYYSLIKNAIVQNGFAEVPVISIALGTGLQNQQPGFEMPWSQLIRPAIEAGLFADALAKLYYPSAPREKEKGRARLLYDDYIRKAQPLLANRQYAALHSLLKQAANDFSDIIDTAKQVPVVGLVGEIYVKYNSFSNKNVARWLIDHGVEVVPPAFTSFFSTSIPNVFINRELHIRKDGLKPWQARLINHLLQRKMKYFDRLCSHFPLYRPFSNIMDTWHLSRQVIQSAADFGEGWFLPGEVCELAEHGVRKVVSLQPFGCIANHIISKGIEQRYKERYPNLSLLFLDFDAGTSEANVTNRLHFLLENEA